MRASQQRQKGLGHAVRTEEIDGKMPFNSGAIAKIVVKVDACVVDQDVERSDVRDSSLNLRRVGHIERQKHDPLIRMYKRLSRAGIRALGASLQAFLDQGPADAAIGPSDQDCFVFDYIHNKFPPCESSEPARMRYACERCRLLLAEARAEIVGVSRFETRPLGDGAPARPLWLPRGGAGAGPRIGALLRPAAR